MNEKQVKRIRRAANADRTTMRQGPHTGVLADSLRAMWPSLNHRQRGAVSFELVNGGRYGLVRAAQRAIRA